jgi:uncharacterized hydrophobic protein (TIGR00271 family)
VPEDAMDKSGTGRQTTGRLARTRLHRWWRMSIVGRIDHAKVVDRIVEESGWSGRYAFMTLMSAGIAVLGLLLSSPAVVIGAMLISPLMNPILGLGFSLALFDFAEMRRSLKALAIGAVLAVGFTALIVLCSPLKAPTAEILARTRPNLFDLLVALFAALAGTFAFIRGRGETIVGVAIATALMPPLAVVGYGLATGNMPVLGGALALFTTNFLTIALSATVTARFYGFGHSLSETQGWAQTTVLALVFIGMSIPLAISLGRIARETVIATQARSFLGSAFGGSARVTQLDIDFDQRPIVMKSVVITARTNRKDTATLQDKLSKRLSQPVKLQLDQVLLDPGTSSLGAQRAELERAADTTAEDEEATRVVGLVALAAGVTTDAVTLDQNQRRATAIATPLAAAGPQIFRTLEQRVGQMAKDWQIAIVPPLGPLPVVRFANNVDTLDSPARDAVMLCAWEARRWNIVAVNVPGLPGGDTPPAKPQLNQRRALAIATLLRASGVKAVAAPGGGQAVSLQAVTQ